MSLMLVAAGLFPPKGTPLEWKSDLNWQPMPFSYEKLFDDSFLLVVKSCPRYDEELKRIEKEDLKAEFEKYTAMFKELSFYTGLDIKSHHNFQHLYDTLKCQQELGLEIPEWAEKYYPIAMQDLMEKGFIFNAYNSVLKKLKGGIFVKKAIEDWEKKIEHKLSQKLFLYSAHDVTGKIDGLLRCC